MKKATRWIIALTAGGQLIGLGGRVSTLESKVQNLETFKSNADFVIAQKPNILNIPAISTRSIDAFNRSGQALTKANQLESRLNALDIPADIPTNIPTIQDVDNRITSRVNIGFVQNLGFTREGDVNRLLGQLLVSRQLPTNLNEFRSKVQEFSPAAVIPTEISSLPSRFTSLRGVVADLATKSDRLVRRQDAFLGNNLLPKLGSIRSDAAQVGTFGDPWNRVKFEVEVTKRGVIKPLIGPQERDSRTFSGTGLTNAFKALKDGIQWGFNTEWFQVIVNPVEFIRTMTDEFRTQVVSSLVPDLNTIRSDQSALGRRMTAETDTAISDTNSQRDSLPDTPLTDVDILAI